jgi:RNA polymerase sigma-70 factor (ECF subfamily)
MAERPLEDPRARAGRLYDAHGAGLYRYAVMLLADTAAAEDAVHQVFITLLAPGVTAKVAVTVDDEAAYLRRAVRNACYSRHRERRARGEVAGEPGGGDLRGESGSGTSQPLLEACAAPAGVPPEERLALERALRALAPEQREVVHLHVFEGLTFQEVATASGESINTIASRYRYALAHMRRLLSGRETARDERERHE